MGNLNNFLQNRKVDLLTDRQKTAQEYLSQIGQNERLLESYFQELAELRELSTNIQSARWTADKVQTSHSNEARFVSIVTKIAELEKKIDAEASKMLDLRIEIRDVIASIPNQKCVLVLRYRYIEFQKWFDMEEKMGMSERQLHNIHLHALNAVANILEARKAA